LTSPDVKQKINMMPAPEGASSVEGEKKNGESKLPTEAIVDKHDKAIGQILGYLQAQRFDQQARQEAFKEWQEEAKEVSKEYEKKTRVRKLVLGTLGFLGGTIIASIIINAGLGLGAELGLVTAGYASLNALTGTLGAMPGLAGQVASSVVGYLPMVFGAVVRGQEFYKNMEEKVNKHFDKNLPEAQAKEAVMARNPNLPENQKILSLEIAERFKNGIAKRREAMMQQQQQQQQQEKSQSNEVTKDGLPPEVIREMKAMMAAR
jgi:uncharacterized protein YbjQ (UPF0145 family)